MPSCKDYRSQIDAALAYAGGSHTFEDIESAVEKGDAFAWFGPHSVIVTEIEEQPRKKVLNFFLAGGVMGELEAMTPLVLEWGREQGCTTARFLGRRGWTRSFLAHTGWQDTGLVIMERAINGVREIQGNGQE